MSLSYRGGGSVSTASITVTGDGTSTAINIPLTLTPLSIPFHSGGLLDHPPTSASFPGLVQVGGQTYVLTATFDTTNFRFNITSLVNQSGGTPVPAGTDIPFVVTFEYSGV